MNAISLAGQLRRIVFNPAGRINRLQFIFGLLLSLIIAWLGPDQRDSSSLYLLLFAIFQLYVMFSVYAKRLHDIGLSAVIFTVIGVALTFLSYFVAPGFVIRGLWGDQSAATIGWIMIAGNTVYWVVLAGYLLIRKGERQDNRFGPAPGSGFFAVPTGDFGIKENLDSVRDQT